MNANSKTTGGETRWGGEERGEAAGISNTRILTVQASLAETNREQSEEEKGEGPSPVPRRTAARKRGAAEEAAEISNHRAQSLGWEETAEAAEISNNRDPGCTTAPQGNQPWQFPLGNGHRTSKAGRPGPRGKEVG